MFLALLIVCSLFTGRVIEENSRDSIDMANLSEIDEEVIKKICPDNLEQNTSINQDLE